MMMKKIDEGGGFWESLMIFGKVAAVVLGYYPLLIFSISKSRKHFLK